MPQSVQVHQLHIVDDCTIAALTDILLDCVAGGASVSFMHPLSRERAEVFWRNVAAGVTAGERALLVAHDGDGSIIGTVQVILAQPDNQPHRADVAKLLVHSKARCGGAGAALMRAVEGVAARAGKTLLVLDTSSVEAERLYRRIGWQFSGTIPDYALFPDGRPCATTIFYKRVGADA